MNKKYIGIFMIIFMLLITCFTTNVSAMKDVDQIQDEVEDLLGMELQLCVQFNITNGISVIGYDLLFIPLDIPVEDINSTSFFEAYYIDGYDTDVDERYLEDSVYEEGSEESISLAGNITMTSEHTVFFVRRRHPGKTSFSRVYAQGIFFSTITGMKIVLDFSYEKHWGLWVKNNWNSYPTKAPDKSWGKVWAQATYNSWPNPIHFWNVGAWVKQYSDSWKHWEKDDWAYQFE